MFRDIFDFAERMAGTVNRKAYDSLLYSGAFDSFGYKRSQYTKPTGSGDAFLDALVKYAELYRKDAMEEAVSLFGDAEEMKPQRPEMPEMNGEENTLDLLHQEKELVGMYLSSHPLDKYAFELNHFTSVRLDSLKSLIEECFEKKAPANAKIGGFITSVSSGTSKFGKPFFRATIEDFDGSYELSVYGKACDDIKKQLEENSAVFIEGRIEELYPRSEEERKAKGDPPFGFRIKNIIHLGNVAETYVKSLKLSISTTMLTGEFRENLVNIIKRNKGSIPLTMTLHDPQTHFKIDFLSRKFQVTITQQLMNQLESIGIALQLVTR